MTDDDLRLALHEAAHTVVALRFAWSLDGVTVEPGMSHAGCSKITRPMLAAGTFTGLDLTLPFVLWPDDAKTVVEQLALFCMAGEVGALELGPRGEGRYELPVRDRAVELAAELPQASAEVVAELRATVDGAPDDSDTSQLARLCWLAHGDDFASHGAWISWLEVQCRALVRRDADKIRILADVLAERPTLSGSAVTALLASW